MWEFLFLLLPLAAFSGWLVGRKMSLFRGMNQLKPFSSQYFVGLNYLLNEQPDKAVDVFVKLLDANQEMVETHLALGSLFRRRGEVDKAIGIHQNLLARSSLSQEQRALSLLELSRDYMRAGMLDRAENLLLELVDRGGQVEASLQHLMEVYQQGKDWLRAIHIAEKLQTKSKRHMGHYIAHFYCELAEQRWLKGSREDACAYLKKALQVNPHCVRASLLQGDIEASIGQDKNALKCYQSVQNQDQTFLSEIVLPVAHCYERLGNPDGMVKYLKTCLQTHPGISVVLAFSDWLQKTKGDDEATQFISEHLQERPSIRGLSHLIQLSMTRAEGTAKNDLATLKELVEKIIANKSLYRCQACGFSSRTLQWQCPGCKRWDVVKPIPE